MTNTFPDLNYKQIVKIAKKLNFVFVRKAGSHEIFKKIDENIFVTIPNHGKKSVKRKTLKNIFEDLKIDIKNYKDFI